MTETEYAKKLEELDRQLNDPDIPMDPARVWALLDELHCRESDSDGGAVLPGHQWCRAFRPQRAEP